jgi:signal transduction histidine kinase
MNLLSNAIQAIPETGKIFINTKVAGDMVKISIKDTGGGMTEEVRKKIYDPFFTTKEVGKGTGLGLYISYGIIEKHNGKIEVFSDVGQGTEFVITMPIEQQISA